MNRARFGRSASKCGANNARPIRFACHEVLLGVETTAGDHEVVQDALHGGAYRGLRPRTVALRAVAASPAVFAGQVEQVGALDVVELQGPGDGVEDALGGSADVAALETGVVVEADPGELGDLLAAQPGDPTFAAEVGNARLCGSHVGAAGRSGSPGCRPCGS